MKFRMSTLQRRISIALTGVVILFVAVQGYLVYLSLERQEDDLVDDIVMSETHRLIGRLADGEEAALVEQGMSRLGPNMQAWLVRPGQAPTGLPAWLQPLEPGLHMQYLDDRVYHSVIRDTPTGRLYVDYDATGNEAFVYEFGGFLLLTGICFVVLGWLLSVWVAHIVVAPIGRLAKRLAEWSPSSTAPTVGTSDEETLLLQAFDQAQRRMDQALAHEREFAANIRHEVRTPLATLRTDAELILLTEARLGDGTRQRLNRIIASADSVVDAVEAAHALASYAPARPEPLDLAACVDTAWASLQHLNEGGRMQLRNLAGRGSERPILDRQALMIILRNLLRNGIQHASPGICEVRRSDTGLEVSDNGPGIPPANLSRIFDRYFSGRLVDTEADAQAEPGAQAGPGAPTGPGAQTRPGASRESGAPTDSDQDHEFADEGGQSRARRAGRGLGLAIAGQTASQQRWRLDVRSTPGQGTTFLLDFE